MQEAVDQFPPGIIKIISNICACFGRSSQKKFKFKEIQKGLGINNTLEILRYVPHQISSNEVTTEALQNVFNKIYQIPFEKEEDYLPLVMDTNAFTAKFHEDHATFD